ncbi:MAG: biotin--[acetyl-CoA-carboxylase] ligase [Gammaproteobacteria bacterium]
MDAAELDALAALLVEAPAPLTRAEIAEDLGLQAHQITSCLAALMELGAPVHEDETGLRLELSDALDVTTIDTGLADLNPPPAVEVHCICESTNVLAGRGQGSSLCLAETQTAGRGRRGHAWVQPFASGLALSYGLPLRVARVDGLAIAAAVAVVEALAACGFPGIGLKWPNDVYACGAKLGGVMVEAAGGREPRLVVGVGLNVHVAPALDGRTTVALAALAPLPSRNVLAIEIVRTLVFALLEFERAGFEPFAHKFAQLDVLAGCRVQLVNGDDTVTGVARGIGSLGEIVVETPAGLSLYTAGEVSLGNAGSFTS